MADTDTQRLLGGLRKTLLVILGLLALSGFAAEWNTYAYGVNDYSWQARFFSLSHEGNLPTWYSSSILLVCAFLLAAIALTERRRDPSRQRPWWVLCGIIAYISLDETATLHERLAGIFDMDGILYFDWVIPAAGFVLVVGLYFLRFVLSLPPATRNRFILAGAIYVGGALLMELPLGWWTDQYGSHNLGYGMIDLVEETMEILGLSIFLLALARVLAERLPGIVRLLPAARPGPVSGEEDGERPPERLDLAA